MNTGLDLWQILVLVLMRLGLDFDYDRLEDLANHHTLLRQILGVAPVAGPADSARMPKNPLAWPTGWLAAMERVISRA